MEIETPIRNVGGNREVVNRIEDCSVGIEMLSDDDVPTVSIANIFGPNAEDVLITDSSNGSTPLSDTDGDGDPDVSDPDNDNDGIPDEEDSDDDGVLDENDPDWCPPFAICDDVNSDPVVINWEEALDDKAGECELLKDGIAILTNPGYSNLPHDVLTMQAGSRPQILQEIEKVSPYLSAEVVKAMLLNSEYFYELDIVAVISSNPYVLYDGELRNFITQSESFTEENRNLILNQPT